MAIPIPPKNGKPVSFQKISFGNMAQRAWGQEWGIPETVYVFSNGSRKESTDMTQNGFYTRS